MARNPNSFLESLIQGNNLWNLGQQGGGTNYGTEWGGTPSGGEGQSQWSPEEGSGTGGVHGLMFQAFAGGVGSQDDIIYGCMNQSACNYNPNATEDDGSCYYAEEFYDCSGNYIGGSGGQGDDEDIGGDGDESEDEGGGGQTPNPPSGGQSEFEYFGEAGIYNPDEGDWADAGGTEGGIVGNEGEGLDYNPIDECGVWGGSGASYQCWNGDVVCDESDCPEQPGDPCENVECESGQRCRNGECVDIQKREQVSYDRGRTDYSSMKDHLLSMYGIGNQTNEPKSYLKGLL